MDDEFRMTFSSDTFVLPTNPSEQVRMSRGDFVAEMTRRFGADPMGWCFFCPRCGLVTSARELEPFGSAAKATLGQVCLGVFRGTCTYSTTTPAGGPMSVTVRTDAGAHLKTSCRLAPTGYRGGDVVPEGLRG